MDRRVKKEPPSTIDLDDIKQRLYGGCDEWEKDPWYTLIRPTQVDRMLLALEEAVFLSNEAELRDWKKRWFGENQVQRRTATRSIKDVRSNLPRDADTIQRTQIPSRVRR